MSNIDPRNPPWNSYEKLELLTEVLKAANVAPEVLIPIVRNLPPPQWKDVAFPRGRTLNQSQYMYQQMIPLQAPPPGLTRAGSIRETPRPIESQLGKRPYTSEGPPLSAGLATQFPHIQPKPPGLPASGGANELSPGEPPKKKRGRPPKAETEMRREQARARGEQYPAPKRTSVPSLAMAGASSAMAAASSWSGPPTRFVAQDLGSAAGPSRPLSMIQPVTTVSRTTPPPHPRPSSEPGSSGRRRRGQQRPELISRASEEEPMATTPGPLTTPSRAYPDILSRDPQEGPSSFRAPRG